jgi:class 3 adenylate cyclase
VPEAPGSGAPPIRLWQRLGVRLAALFATVTLLAVGLVGVFIYDRQKREIEDTIGVQLLNIARTGALLIDPALHAEVQRTLTQDSEAYARVRAALAEIRTVVVLPTPTYTLTDYDPATRQARFMVTSDGPGRPGEPYALVPELIEPLGWTFEDGVARHTRIYRNQHGTWITAFAPVVDGAGRTIAVLDVDYPVNVYLDRLEDLRFMLVQTSVAGAIAALILGLLFARRFTRPISALTSRVGRVAAGDLSQALPVRSSDEVGQLTRAFNAMLEGLRQRDFIRATFGRYVSPEVAQTLLASPEALRLGGSKREVTILMSDLRGYTRFAEQGEPAEVMAILNACLGRLSEVVIAYGGTINEFIGDAIFAIFGAPLDHPDHAERAAAAALAMQRAMAELNTVHAARGLPRFDMGIGVNTGEAVVGNIGSEHRAKYGVVGNAVNTASRIEAATVGGQILVSAATYARIQHIAEVGRPVTVTVKGLSEPLSLYELRALGGRFDLRLPEAADAADLLAEIALPLACWVIEGKTVGADALAGTTVRLGRRRLEARFDVTLPPLTNVRLRLTYPTLGRESRDLYGKVVEAGTPDGRGLTTVHFTSVDPADVGIIERLLAG